jgi:hypothetical protein
LNWGMPCRRYVRKARRQAVRLAFAKM